MTKAEQFTLVETGTIHVGLTRRLTLCCTNVITSGLANVKTSAFFG